MPSSSFVATAAVLLAAVRFTAAGSFTIKNSCSETLVANKCQNGDHYLPDIEAGHSSEPQDYDSTTSGGTGVSYKIFPKSSQVGEPMQFEYSVVGDGQVWFDLSNIDGYPQMFVDGGVTVTPTGTGSNCKEILCPQGERHCGAAYNVWNDDQKAMRNCDTGCDIVLDICSGGKEASDSSSGSDDSGSSSGSDDSGSSSGSDNSGYSAPPVYSQPPAPQSSAPPAEGYNMVQENSEGKAYGDAPNGLTTVVVAATETQTIMGRAAEPTEAKMHRRHLHGHAHHHG